MAEIKIMSAGAVKSMVAALSAEFENETGNKLDLNFGTAGSLRERIKNGEVADLVVLSESAIAELAKLGFVVPGSRRPHCRGSDCARGHTHPRHLDT